MLPQFAQRFIYKVNWDNIALGTTTLLLGLFKKVVIADGIAVWVTPIFAAADAGQQITFFEAWAGSIGYTLQLYFDFSGYSDMAIGLGQLFNIKLPINSTPHTKQQILLTSGVAGISPYPDFYATICIFRLEATGKEKSGDIKTFSSL